MTTSDSLPLPWGQQDEGNAAQGERDEDLKFVSIPLSDAGLASGDKIEVKWTVSTEEGDDVCKWWGAVVIGPSSPSSTIVREGAQGAVETTECEQVVKNVMLDEVPLELAHQFVLKYEAGEGFEEEEVATIAFLSDHWLYDVGKGFELAFRKLGDVWEPEEEEEEADGAAVISIASFSGEAERARNREILAAASDSLMAGLDPFRQRLVAGGIQQFTEVLGSMIRSKPEGSIITREDVEEAFRGKKPRL